MSTYFDYAKPIRQLIYTTNAVEGLQRQPAQGWGVQIGVFNDYGNVLIQAEKLQNQFGQPIILDISELEGKTVYKIIVGTFADAGGAQSLQQRMLTAG